MYSKISFLSSFIFLLLSCSPKPQANRTLKKYANKYDLFIKSDEVFIGNNYHQLFTHNPKNGKYIKRVFLPEDKTLIEELIGEDQTFIDHTGRITEYYPNGNVKLKTQMVSGKKHGAAVGYYYESKETKKYTGIYGKGKRMGNWVQYNKDGSLKSSYHYVNDKRSGSFELYENGELIKAGDMREDTIYAVTIVSKNYIPKEERVKERPRFRGCEDLPVLKEKEKCAQQKMIEYSYKNLRYPALDREHSMEGRSIFSFIVGKDGYVKDVKAIKVFSRSIESEGIKLISNMPKMIPGTEDGKPIDVEFKIPIVCKLQ